LAVCAVFAVYAEGTVPSEEILIFAPVTAPFLIFAVVTAFFLSFAVFTEFFFSPWRLFGFGLRAGRPPSAAVATWKSAP
jgi:hypothetical protein